MKGMFLGLGGLLLLLGCARQGVVKLGEGHYQATCTSSTRTYANDANYANQSREAARTAYAQCQKKAEELCKSPYDLKRLRSESIPAGSGWITRERYEILCHPAVVPAAPSSPPAALPAPPAPGQPAWDDESTAAAGAPAE